MRSDRLWPILFVLALALSGVAAIEWLAAHPIEQFVTIEVHNTAGANEDSEDSSATSWQLSRPTDAEHARARQLLLRGDIEEATSHYLLLVAATVPSATMLAEVAYVLRRAGRCRAAVAFLDRALLRAPLDGAIHLADALTHRCLENNDRASASFERALELRPNHSGTRELFSRFLARSEQRERAIDVLEPATRFGSNEDRARALAARGRLLGEIGQYDAARAAVEEAILRAPALVAIWISGARTMLLLESGADHERGLQLALQATRLAPDLFAPHSAAGRAFEKLDRNEEALASYVRAAALDTNARFVRTRIVELGLSLDPAAAQEAAEQLIARDPDAELYFLHGLAAARAGDLTTARESYMNTIRERNGVAPEAWFNLGRLEREAGRLEAARQAYTSAIAVRPEYSAAWNNLGLVYFDLHRFDEAETAFRQALDLRPDYSAPWSNLGRMYSTQNNDAEAVTAYEQALALNPDDRVDRLRLAAAYRRTNRLQEAIAAYEALVASEPRYVAAWFNLGIALVAAGRDEDAVQAYVNALAIDPNHQDSLENLGYLQSRLGATTKALLYLTEALDREPSDLSLRLEIARLAAQTGNLARCRNELRAAVAQAPQDQRVVALTDLCRDEN